MVEGAVTGPGLEADVRVDRSDGFRLEIDLTIPPGRTVALLGPNGAGKSTAVASIAGLLPIDAGRIALGGVVLDHPAEGIHVPPEQRKVGVVFQDYLLFPHLSVAENVAFGLRSRGAHHDEALSRSRSWLGRLGIEDLASRKPGDLSGGQAQRVALCRALVAEPDLLLLDEPLSALDVTTRTELRHTLGEHLAAFEGPRLLITHDATEAFLLSDDVHVIEDGRVTQAGTPDDIRLRPRTRYAADLAGSNLVAGTAHAGSVDTGSQVLQIADDELEGPVLVTINPTAVSVHARRPEGSPRNSWLTTVRRVEQLGSRARLLTGDPLPLAVEVTDQSRVELGLAPGVEIWVALKATEIGVESDAGG
jgi:molybdate transport system ATP-binding protein